MVLASENESCDTRVISVLVKILVHLTKILIHHHLNKFVDLVKLARAC
jgi:hypothetical protein